MSRFPLTRIGLTLVVGSVLASLFMFYIGLGTSMADMSHEAPSTEARGLIDHFLHHFLFVSVGPGSLFWLGLVIMILGIARNFMAPRSPK